MSALAAVPTTPIIRTAIWKWNSIPRGDDDVTVFPPVVCVISVLVMATDRCEAVEFSSVISLLVNFFVWFRQSSATVHCNTKYVLVQFVAESDTEYVVGDMKAVFGISTVCATSHNYCLQNYLC